jgi:hypothetical protein
LKRDEPMLDREPHAPLAAWSVAARHLAQSWWQFAEAIGIASVTGRIGWGVTVLVALVGNAILALVVTVIVRLVGG